MGGWHRSVALLLVASIAATPGIAAAQGLGRPGQLRFDRLSADDVLIVAANLIDEGRFEEALLILDQLARDEAGGAQRDFLDGMISMARGDLSRSEAMFRKILDGDPGLVRVRLELARALFLQRKDEDADYHFRLAIAERPADGVIANVARFREAIRARRAWRINLTLGIAPDSNINSATDKERVDLFGLPFAIDPESRSRSGVGMIAGVDASMRLRRDTDLPIYVGAFGRSVRYKDDRFDDHYIGGEIGPEFRLKGGRLRVAATGLSRWYGGRHLVVNRGAKLAFDKVFGGRWGIDAALMARHNAYSRRSDVDGWEIEAAFQTNRALGASTLGMAFISGQRMIANDPGHSGWQARAGVAVLKELGWGLRPQLTVEAGRRVNDSPLAPFNRVRRDWQVRASASLYKRDWNVLGFSPSLSVTWQRDISTIALYDQRRIRTEFGVTKAF